ncbi:hypothetical protein [Micromonospora sp. WMMD1082]|uniref:hypothetical protein n=1 Tax=Micromonospora sp. WMMD1082 TaxID=3016104 RepID=UPI0024167F05|nr:hypothetical protein [Micromonospora sp. WMMD1082]MDG4793712.1 hypothetical protein [Micromonospora sp. WMMD1082]
MSTIYLASTAMEEVERAQAELERHLTVRPTGECVTCGQVEPCSGRQEAGTTIIKYGLLPRRRPGASGVRRTSPTTVSAAPISWFASATDGDGHELTGTGSEA